MQIQDSSTPGTLREFFADVFYINQPQHIQSYHLPVWQDLERVQENRLYRMDVLHLA